MSIPIFLFTSFCFTGTASAALIALRGIFTKNFRFVKDRTLGKKRYKGKQAARWGIIFFLVFGFVSFGLAVVVAQEMHFSLPVSLLYFLLLVFLTHLFNSQFHHYN